MTEMKQSNLMRGVKVCPNPLFVHFVKQWPITHAAWVDLYASKTTPTELVKGVDLTTWHKRYLDWQGQAIQETGKAKPLENEAKMAAANALVLASQTHARFVLAWKKRDEWEKRIVDIKRGQMTVGRFRRDYNVPARAVFANYRNATDEEDMVAVYYRCGGGVNILIDDS